MKKTLSFLLLLSLNFNLFGQDYQKVLFKKNTDSLPYRILLPKNFDSTKEYPLLLFLHGAGERGNDNEAQLYHSSNFFLNYEFRNTFPSIIIFPQCPKNSYWAKIKGIPNPKYPTQKESFSDSLPINSQLLIVESLLSNLENKYKIDPDKRYIAGLSMGGMGTFELVARNPNYFAAGIAICGGANPNWAKFFKNTPLWIFHGMKDKVVPPELSINIYNSIKNYNSESKLTLYNNVGHNSWDPAFEEVEIMNWLFSFKKK
tara:strand:- start:3599 stop:4375 length:777 start_codon:yes stop_codon:yes gene_type:complete